ncbi:putative nucleoside-diphosphate sugar epimerase [Paraburkholderia piptadeniae]|uniref:Nucleoside-diphosphate sugar epimerase n=1 Tax=Paraburkholderia piptadeniae TaxID=1701573 RepID=A0A1N7SJY7_9BURK|nr:NmrA family NAD(P)-binding protein [Paraburkholderia piptadeniae]SIT47715.1 putative nucleoside-diphosphate sugar epimerase [Paraburkholderia piptadeniae]
MFAITGITGQVGGVVAQTLLAQRKPVRAVVRSAEKGAPWAARGCEIALAEMHDEVALRRAFQGAEGVFVLLPPVFDPSPDFAESRRNIAALRGALNAAKPSRVVVLSTIGAQATQPNLLNQLGIMEQELRTLPMPVVFLRAAWFFENCAWDVEPARRSGVIPAFLQPLDKPVPMVATDDIGRVAAHLFQDTWTGARVVELEGPRRVTPDEIAAAFASALDRPVRMQIVPRGEWEALFRAQGMKNPLPRMQMLDGFNEGWIEFDAPASSLKGSVTVESVIRELVERSA